MDDAAVAFYSEALKKVSETEEWKTEYLDRNMLIRAARRSSFKTLVCSRNKNCILAEKSVFITEAIPDLCPDLMYSSRIKHSSKAVRKKHTADAYRTGRIPKAV